jgi:outer membrane protein assembly factor BamB
MMNEQPKRQGISRMFTPRLRPSHIPHCSFLLLVNLVLTCLSASKEVARAEESAALPVTFRRTVEARNMDLCRFIPFDGNTVYSATGLLRKWPANGAKELWRVQTGPSIAAVVEAEGRTFAAGQLDGKQWAYCVEAKTGKVIWKTELGPEFMLPHHWWGTVASPLVDEGRVYYIPYRRAGDPRHQVPGGEICPLVCLRVSDGKELWRSGGEIPFVNGFATPLVIGERLFVLPQRESEVLIALDKRTGKHLWKGGERQPKHGGAPFAGASLSYQELNGIGQLVYGIGNGEIAGVSPADGSVLWTVERTMGHGLMCSAAVVEDRVVLSCGENKWSMALQMRQRDGTYTEPLTTYESPKLQVGWFNTPAVHDGAVYGFGTFSMQCTDLATGELLWEQFKRNDWDAKQQLIIADGLIFATTVQKEVVLIEASKAAYKQLGRTKHGMNMGHTQQPTLANGRLYLRGMDEVLCYQVHPELLGSTPDTGSAVPARRAHKP